MAENTFIIRIWCEHSEQGYGKPQLRGVIEHAVTGQRQYLKGSQTIIQFIKAQISDKPEFTQPPHAKSPLPDQQIQ